MHSPCTCEWDQWTCECHCIASVAPCSKGNTTKQRRNIDSQSCTGTVHVNGTCAAPSQHNQAAQDPGLAITRNHLVNGCHAVCHWQPLTKCIAGRGHAVAANMHAHSGHTQLRPADNTSPVAAHINQQALRMRRRARVNAAGR